MPFLSLSRVTSLPLRLYRSEAKGMLGCHSDEGIRALQQGSVALRQRKTYFAKPPELCQNFYSREQMNDLVILTRSRTCLTLRRRYANILGHSWRHLSALTLFPSLLTSPSLFLSPGPFLQCTLSGAGCSILLATGSFRVEVEQVSLDCYKSHMGNQGRN